VLGHKEARVVHWLEANICVTGYAVLGDKEAEFTLAGDHRPSNLVSSTHWLEANM